MIVLVVVLLMLSLTTVPTLPLAVNWGLLTNYYTLAIVLLTLGIVRYYRIYQSNKQGFEGENRVTRYLRSNFSDDHFLVNDIVYINDKGHNENIDHIVLSPNGIFAIETKDYRGKIMCRGSFWTVPFPYGRSPSKQARGSAYWVKKIVDASGILQDVNLWVNPIVVFSNPDVELEAIDPEVEVVKLDDLADSINSFSHGYNFSEAQLKTIGEKIMEKALSV